MALLAAAHLVCRIRAWMLGLNELNQRSYPITSGMSYIGSSFEFTPLRPSVRLSKQVLSETEISSSCFNLPNYSTSRI
ncbi:unnamed protein product [Protopolystoma xenopodis]|uniref:Uncharacterized protein n=1 Tax=Protopolystoma xenopodis TaxID=117903 RepID=A0A3S5B2K7_9PLAT|nr:unnamed protein product [Protopolystoma xenopodis]